MEDSQVERQWTKFQHNFTSAYNFTPSELENLGKLGMDLGPRIVWDILFVTMILVGVAGNLMVLWIVTGTDIFFFFKCNFFQKHLFLHQLAHNMTKDCLLNYKFSQYEHVVHINWFFSWHLEQFMYTRCSELVIFMHWTCNSMNNLSSYCWLVYARISAYDKGILVTVSFM